MQFVGLDLDDQRFLALALTDLKADEGFWVINLTEKPIYVKGGFALMPEVKIRRRILDAACRDSNYVVTETYYGVTLLKGKPDPSVVTFVNKLITKYPSLRFIVDAEVLATYGRIFTKLFVAPTVCTTNSDPLGLRLHPTLKDVYATDEWLVL